MTIADLIRQLEVATGPDRELDAEIQRLVDPEGGRVFHVGAAGEVNAFTKRIDAAVMLVPDGWAWSVEHSTEYGSYGGCSPKAPNDEWVHSDMGGSGIYAATPAIALCIAALRARAVTMMDDTDNKKPPVPRRTGAAQGLSA